MSAPRQAPQTVIAARTRLIGELATVGGERLTQPNREALADWLITSGYLSESYYAAVEAETGEPA